MANKGQIMTQSHYEKEQKYIRLLKESFGRREIPRDEVINELRSIGFNLNRAIIISEEWLSNISQFTFESTGVMKKRLKEIASLKKYFFKKKGIKKWDEESKKYIPVIEEPS